MTLHDNQSVKQKFPEHLLLQKNSERDQISTGDETNSEKKSGVQFQKTAFLSLGKKP